MRELPCLPLIQERFFNEIKPYLISEKIKRPEFEILNVFSQVWGSTALGFGDFGGQAITSAYTTVILSQDLGIVGVFFGERLAYIVHHVNDTFWEDLNKHNMKSVKEHGIYERK